MGRTFRSGSVNLAVVVRAASALAVLVAGLGAGCTTVSAPVLRHETGEALGEKHFRVFAHFETSRLLTPGAPVDKNVALIPQDNGVFQGSFFGVQAEGGVLPKLDLQLGANFTAGGGGWRVGAKYELYRVGRIAVAGMAGYAVASGSGNVTYLTNATPETIALTLSAWTLDFAIPASIRVSNIMWVYGGPLMLHSGVSGSYGGAVVNDYNNDWGFNLGVRFAGGMFVGDLEFAEVLVNDPFMIGERFIPYAGVSFGVVF